MTVTVFHDTFTDTAGTSQDSHTPEIGGPWVMFGGGLNGTAAPQIFSDGSCGNSSSSTVFSYRMTTAPATADGETITVQSVYSTASGKIGIGLRGDPAAGSGYVALFDAGGSHVLYRIVSGALTSLGSFSGSMAAAPLLSMEVSGTGATVTIAVKMNGTHVTGSPFSDTSGSRLTSPGRGCLATYGLSSATFGIRPTEVTVTNVDPPATGTITCTSPAADLIIQKSGSSGSATVAGAFTGTPGTIERRVVLSGTSTVVSGFDWATAVASPSGASYSFTVTGIPAALEWYQVQVRHSSDTGVTATSPQFGIGHVVALIGQSNAVKMFETTGGPSAGTHIRMSGITPAGWTVPTGAGAKQLANVLSTAMSCPVALIYAAYGGTSITGWRPYTPPPNGSQFNLSLPYMQLPGLVIGDMVFIQGEFDWDGMSYATYAGHLAEVAPGFRTALSNASMPFHVVGLASTTTTPRSTYDEVKKAQYDYATGTALAYWVDRTDCALVDGLHHSAAGFVVLADRIAQSVLAANGVVSQSRGPSISSVSYVSSGVYDVTLTHHLGSDITPSSGSSGWGVTDAGAGGASIAVTAADRQSATVVRLTLASAPVGAPTVTYNKGGSVPSGTLVRDNSALTLPLEYAYGSVALASSVTVTLQNGPTPQAGLTGLKWAFWPVATPDLITAAPVAKGTAETTDGSGVLTFSIAGLTALPSGGVGYLVVTDSDGDPAQSPACKALAGPVTVI